VADAASIEVPMGASFSVPLSFCQILSLDPQNLRPSRAQVALIVPADGLGPPLFAAVPGSGLNKLAPASAAACMNPHKFEKLKISDIWSCAADFGWVESVPA
jgi:hypothetical protein